MSKVNIQGLTNISDPFYRYKRERLNVVTARALMAITNMDSVASDLGRTSEMIIEFFKNRFGSSFKYKQKKLEYSAKIMSDDLEKALDEFIEFFVICEFCRLPETNMIIDNKKNTIDFDCRSCGKCSKINPINVQVKQHIKKTCQSILTKNMKSCTKSMTENT